MAYPSLPMTDSTSFGISDSKALADEGVTVADSVDQLQRSREKDKGS